MSDNIFEILDVILRKNDDSIIGFIVSGQKEFICVKNNQLAMIIDSEINGEMKESPKFLTYIGSVKTRIPVHFTIRCLWNSFDEGRDKFLNIIYLNQYLTVFGKNANMSTRISTGMKIKFIDDVSELTGDNYLKENPGIINQYLGCINLDDSYLDKFRIYND